MRAKRRAIEEIVTLLLGVIDARHQVLLSMNVPVEISAGAVVATLPALKRPTVSRLHGVDYYSIQTRRPERPGQYPHPKSQGRRGTGYP